MDTIFFVFYVIFIISTQCTFRSILYINIFSRIQESRQCDITASSKKFQGIYCKIISPTTFLSSMFFSAILCCWFSTYHFIILLCKGAKQCIIYFQSNIWQVYNMCNNNNNKNNAIFSIIVVFVAVIIIIMIIIVTYIVIIIIIINISFIIFSIANTCIITAIVIIYRLLHVVVIIHILRCYSYNTYFQLYLLWLNLYIRSSSLS